MRITATHQYDILTCTNDAYNARVLVTDRDRQSMSGPAIKPYVSSSSSGAGSSSGRDSGSSSGRDSGSSSSSGSVPPSPAGAGDSLATTDTDSSSRGVAAAVPAPAAVALHGSSAGRRPGRPRGAKDKASRKRGRRAAIGSSSESESDEEEEQDNAEQARRAQQQDELPAAPSADSTMQGTSEDSTVEPVVLRVTRARNSLPTTSAVVEVEAPSDLYAEIEERQRNPPKKSKKKQEKEARLQYNNRG